MKEHSFIKFFFNQFKSVWDDDSKLEDVTEAIIDYISSAYEDNSPMPVFDAFRYGKQNVYFREYFRVCREPV